MARSSKQTDLDRLVKEHLPSALRFATRLTGGPDAAEEIVQESLVRAARSWKSFRGEAEFQTWLFRIVINVFRSRVRDARTAERLPPELADHRECDPATGAENLELGARIAALVSGLPPRQREVMVLSAYEGRSPKEVAALVGITEANVYTTLRVARDRLRGELAPYFAQR
jgi:RNA polymerase sigma-70 factor (ECF subfamily)